MKVYDPACRLDLDSLAKIFQKQAEENGIDAVFILCDNKGGYFKYVFSSIKPNDNNEFELPASVTEDELKEQRRFAKMQMVRNDAKNIGQVA